jgi:hypothetical protein
MVKGGAIGGEDIFHGGDGLATSLPISSSDNVDIHCQRLPHPLSCCHLTPLPPPAKTAEEAGSEAAKYTMVSNGNLSPPSATNEGFGCGTHLPPPPVTGQSSPVDCHCLPKPQLLRPHRLPPPAAILALVASTTACCLCKEVAALPSSQRSPPHSACSHCSVCHCRPMPQPQPWQLTTTTAVTTFM